MTGLLKADSGFVTKKGSACFYANPTSLTTTNQTDLNIFGNVVQNDSLGIVKNSDTQVTLAPNKKYKVSLSTKAGAFSNAISAYINIRYWLAGLDYGACGQVFSATYSNTSDAMNQVASIIIEKADVARTLKFTAQINSGTAVVGGDIKNFCTIEEMEDYGSQALGTVYADKIIGNASSGVQIIGRTDGIEPTNEWAIGHTKRISVSGTLAANTSTLLDFTDVSLPIGTYIMLPRASCDSAIDNSITYFLLKTGDVEAFSFVYSQLPRQGSNGTNLNRFVAGNTCIVTSQEQITLTKVYCYSYETGSKSVSVRIDFTRIA